MKAEKVIVIGVNSQGEAFATCANYTTDEKLEEQMIKKHSCNDFIVFFEENIDELDEVLQKYYASVD